MGRIAATRDVLTRLTHMAAADGRLDLALSLNGVTTSLDNSETEACAILRLLDDRANAYNTVDQAKEDNADSPD